LFVWLVSLFNKNEATPASTPVAAPVAPTAAATEGGESRRDEPTEGTVV
jgi:hypothetical protein